MISKSISKASRLWTPSGWEQQVGSACGKLLLELLFHRIPLPLREGFSSPFTFPFQAFSLLQKGFEVPRRDVVVTLS